MSDSLGKRLVTRIAKTVFLTITLILGLVFSFAVTSSALAQGTPSNSRPEQGLSISPFILERQMDKGQSTSETIEVTNTTDRTLPVDISVNDFTASGEDGQQTFFEPGEGDQTYALSKWITITNSPKLVLKAGEKTQVQFTITAPTNAEDGGHYGAIIFSFSSPPVNGSAVSVAQKLAAIILVKTGKVKEDGLISSFSTKQTLYQNAPITFLTKFKNTGNVHVKPRGAVTITNMFGKKVGTALVNPNANNVLPNSDRIFESTWQDNFAFGYYKASVELVYGDSGTVVKSQTGFWVIPIKLVGGVALLLFIIIFGLSFGMRRYNRWIMQKLQEQGSSRSRSKK